MTDITHRSHPRARCRASRRAGRAAPGYWQRRRPAAAARPRDDDGQLVLLAIVIICGLARRWSRTHDPYAGSVLARLKPIGTPGHWLGTDETGRDLWTRLVYGGRLSLIAGITPVLIAMMIGGLLGILAGLSAAASSTC